MEEILIILTLILSIFGGKALTDQDERLNRPPPDCVQVAVWWVEGPGETPHFSKNECLVPPPDGGEPRDEFGWTKGCYAWWEEEQSQWPVNWSHCGR